MNTSMSICIHTREVAKEWENGAAPLLEFHFSFDVV